MTEQKDQPTPEVSDLDEKDMAAVASLFTRLKGKERQLHAKIADVMMIAERIPKRGKAPAAMGGFPFVQVGDAADFIRKALGRRNVSMMPTRVTIVDKTEHPTKSGGTTTIVDLVSEWTLTDGDTNESITIMSFGAGGDTGDKYSGKAMTNSMKYAFLAGFLLSTGDDVELNDVSDRQSDPGEQSSEPRGRATSGRGRQPAQGGKQADQTQPQSKMIGDLLRQAGARTAVAAAELIEKLTGTKVELGEDKPAALAAHLKGLDAQASGKLVHDLRKHVEGLKGEGGDAEGGAAAGADKPSSDGPQDSGAETEAAPEGAGSAL